MRIRFHEKAARGQGLPKESERVELAGVLQSFTPGGLRHAAFQLGQGAVKKRASVRLARLVRVAPREAAPATGAGVVIEIGGARVAVPAGVDQPTLATVVEVLSAAARAA